jgi:hypothetical protein
MDLMRVFARTWKGHGYIFLVVSRFSKLCIPIPCKKTMKGKDASNVLFDKL